MNILLKKNIIISLYYLTEIIIKKKKLITEKSKIIDLNKTIEQYNKIVAPYREEINQKRKDYYNKSLKIKMGPIPIDIEELYKYVYKEDCSPEFINLKKLFIDYNNLRKKQREERILKQSVTIVKPIVDLD